MRTAIEQATRPSLVFDTARLDANAQMIREAARDYTVLFAVKSFPHADVRAIVAKYFDGFDVASEAEAAAVSGRVISIVDPTGRSTEAKCERLIVGCETVEQVAAAPARAEIALRISLSITGRDPAVGAIHDGDRRKSRFGVETREQVAALRPANRRVGIHVHHGPVAATSSERFIATARAALALCDFEPAFLDVGGAWHAVADLPRTLRELRDAIPRSIELIIEPGRVITNEAGFACGRVITARDRIRVVELSRICHLRWSQIELVTEHPGRGEPLVFVGPTCFEDDVLGEWVTEHAVGARMIVRNVSGYAVGWNTSFGGVPAADVVLA